MEDEEKEREDGVVGVVRKSEAIFAESVESQFCSSYPICYG